MLRRPLLILLALLWTCPAWSGSGEADRRAKAEARARWRAQAKAKKLKEAKARADAEAKARAQAKPSPRLPPPAEMAFFEEVKRRAEAHDWTGVMSLCEPQHKVAMIGDMGMDRAQYIAEIFGLNMADNSLRAGAPPTQADLDTIKRVRYMKFTKIEGGYEATGQVDLMDGRFLNISLMITRSGSKLYLTGAMG